MPPGTIAVALSIKNEIELLQLEQLLINNMIPHKAIREPDQNNELMAIGVVPCEKQYVKKFLGRLKLVR